MTVAFVSMMEDIVDQINCMQPHIESCIIAEYSAGDIFANQLRRLNF